MKKQNMYKIGKKLGISKKEVKAAMLKKRNIIMAGIIISAVAFMANKIWFEPLHYNGASISDLNFFTRFF